MSASPSSGDPYESPVAHESFPSADRAQSAARRRNEGGELRQHVRFPAWIEATLHDVDGATWQHVMITDVSLGGAGIQLSRPVSESVTGRTFLLIFEWRLRLCEFWGEVVGESRRLGFDHLHVRFLPNDWKQTRALHAMIAGMEGEDFA